MVIHSVPTQDRLSRPVLLALPEAPDDEYSGHFLYHLGANVAQHRQIVKRLFICIKLIVRVCFNHESKSVYWGWIMQALGKGGRLC